MDEYRLPFTTYSQNKYTGRHWSFKHQVNIQQAILTRYQMAPKTPKPWPVRLTIKSYRHRKLDYGNLVGGCKGLVDILVRQGYLWDDSPIWVDDNYQQYTIPKAMRPYTVVQLTDFTRMELDTTQRHEIAKQQGAEQPWKKAERAKAENSLKRKAKRLENK